MPLNRWVSLRVLIGGSLVALVAALWGLLEWHAPHWSMYIVSTPFVFVSAVFRDRRIYLYILLLYVFAHVGLDLMTGEKSFMIASDSVQWISIGVASEIIFQNSKQRRRTDELSRRRINELEVMNKTLAEISSELELNTLLQTITERAATLLQASLGELLLFDKQTGEMQIVAQYPLNPDQIGFKMKPGDGAMGRVAETKQPLILNNYKSFVNALPDDITSGIEATLDVPLLQGNEFVGVLGVARHTRNREFTLDDQGLLMVFASQAAIAIENASLYKEVQHLAFTDVLTGMNNRRRFFELADKEYERSVRYGRPLSFMIVDIDHFKEINDRYGHAAGDDALKWFAEECNLIIRQKVDVVGRIGGEEFAVIYPEIQLPSAIIAGERLRRQVADKRFKFEGNQLQITFSAGIASLSLEDEISIDEIIKRADKALYHAKQRRNCMAYWDVKTGAPVYFQQTGY